ncbi:MAG: hypothetical protein M0P58_09850 [Bacteroidales bacterium]|nr:hypothetical protein [Bacteroidales bacterium]
MNLLPFEGYMIPGLHFNDCGIWILNWNDNPTPYKKMVEVWILWYDGRKECYISPIEAEHILRKYHSFDSIIPSEIDISHNTNGIDLKIAANGKNICVLSLTYKESFKYWLISLMLKIGNKDRIGEKGRTETGKYYHNIPKKIIPLLVKKAELNGIQLQGIVKPQIKFPLGDGKPSDEPLINFCTHMLEE